MQEMINICSTSVVVMRMIFHTSMTSVTCIFKSMLKIWRGFRREAEKKLKLEIIPHNLKRSNHSACKKKTEK